MMLHILTLTWEGFPLLHTLYTSIMPALEALQPNLDWKWHIKDNGSTDGTVKFINEWNNLNIIPYNYPNNKQSFAEGMNYLFNKTHASDEDYVLLLNNDVQFQDDQSLNKMISVFNNDVGIVGARLCYTGTNKLQHAGIVFHPANQLPIHYRVGEQSDSNAELNRKFQAVTGAVSLTKAKYYKQICSDNKSGINGLNEKYQWMYEDIDMCLAIGSSGKKIIYCGETKITHRESATLKNNPMNKLFLQQNIKTFRSLWHGKYLCDKDLYENKSNYGLVGI